LLGFFNRFSPPKVEITLTISEVNLAEARVKGKVHLECGEAFRTEEIRLEARVFEKGEHKVRANNGKIGTQHEMTEYYSKDLPISRAFEATPGYKGDYQFEIIIPRYESKHNKPISRTLKAVVNVKGRPDAVSDIIHPFVGIKAVVYEAAVARDLEVKAKDKEREEKLKEYAKSVKPIF
jgi:hypothetical protein